MQNREFEKISDTEKEQVIEQLHQTWSHPDNEAVKTNGTVQGKKSGDS